MGVPIRVDALKEGTADYLARRQTNIEIGIVGAPAGNGVGYVDGIVTTTQLMQLCDAVRAKMPDIKFGIADPHNAVWLESANQHLVTDIWMYTEGDAYAPMRLSYRSHSRSSGGQWHYGVYSRTIVNNTFTLGHEKYHTNVCKAIPTAMKNVEEHYKPYAAQTLPRAALTSVQDNLRAVRTEKTRIAVQVRNKLAMHPAFVRCMESLVNQGVTFIDPVVEELVKQMIAAYEDARPTVTRVDGYHVYVKVVAAVQYFVVTYVEGLEHATHNDIHDNTPCVTYTVDSLPDDIAGKVATLSLFPNIKFLEGVGKKLGEYEYWVLK
jgi:hypothetical protein